MNKITFILGGARSGKSRFALETAKKIRGKVAFIATCQPLDTEMKKRIRLHRQKRPPGWRTFEEPENLAGLLKKITSKFDCLIIDCLTLYVSNLYLKGKSGRHIENAVKKTLALLKKSGKNSILVSNEVGLGIVPENNMAREFRDIAGRVNQAAACYADNVYLMSAGIPLKIK